MLTDFLKAIRLTAIGAEYFRPDLANAIHRARFGTLSHNQAKDLERLGAAILDADDIDLLPAAHFDENGLLLPTDGLLGEATAIGNRLARMLFLPGDQAIVTRLFKALNDSLKPGPTNDDAGVTIAPRAAVDRRWLARFLAARSQEAPALVTALLNGRLADAEALVIEQPRQPEWQYAVRCIRMAWSVFDLQIMTYRLHAAEMKAFENGTPQLTTLRSLQALIKEMFEMAKLAESAFRAGHDGNTIDSSLKRFISDLDLELLASKNRDNLAAVGATSDAAAGDVVRYNPNGGNEAYLHALADYLDYLHRIMARAVAKLLAMGRKAAGGAERREAEANMKQELADLKRETTVSRLGVTTLVGFVFAVQNTAAAIGNIPVITGVRKPQTGKLLGPHARRRLERELFTIFRALILRDARHADAVKRYPPVGSRFENTKPADMSTAAHAIEFAKTMKPTDWLIYSTDHMLSAERLPQRTVDAARALSMRNRNGSADVAWANRNFRFSRY